MRDRSPVVLVALVLGLVLATGCTRGVHGGDPSLPLSATNGTARVFAAPESMVLAAISNAFATSDADPRGYRGMDLTVAAQSYIGANWHVTNGFILFPLEGPIATVPLEGRPAIAVPYSACFNITAKPMDDSHTLVSVRTVYAMVTDGRELGVHAGWANHKRNVSPVRVEEENVLDAISRALAAPPDPPSPNP